MLSVRVVLKRKWGSSRGVNKQQGEIIKQRREENIIGKKVYEETKEPDERTSIYRRQCSMGWSLMTDASTKEVAMLSHY